MGRRWKPTTSCAFGIEVLRGLVRIGMEEVGTKQQWAYGGSGKKMSNGQFSDYACAYGAGDVIQCTCGPDGIQYAKDGEDVGVAFETPMVGELGGFVCGKDDFSVRLLFWEDDAPFEGEVFEPPRFAVVQTQHAHLCAGDVVNARSRDGRGFCFVFTVDEEDGTWVPEGCLSFDLYPSNISDAPHAFNAPPERDRAQEQATASTHSNADYGPPASRSNQLSRGLTVEPRSNQLSRGLQPQIDQLSGGLAVGQPTVSTKPSHVSEVQIGVTGLSTWLQELSLMQYEPQAVQWCVENGAVDLAEVLDDHEAFCDALSMRPIEKRRVRKAVEKR